MTTAQPRCPRYLLTLFLLCSIASSIQAEDGFTLVEDDVVVFLGGTNMLRMQQAGYLEAILSQRFAAANGLRFRDLCWEADTVFQQGTVIERWRPDGFGNRTDQLKRVGTTVVIAQFGQLESMQGPDKLDTFVRAYEQLLDDLAGQARLVVLVSPTPFDKPANSLLPDLEKQNTNLSLYVQATRALARQRGLLFVDLFTASRPGMTANGMHILPSFQESVARQVTQQLGANTRPTREFESLRRAVIEKHRLWYDYWRPANWKLLYGDDSRRQFTRGGEDHIPFREEWNKLIPLIATAEERIGKLLRGEQDPGLNRPDLETLHGDEKADILQELAAFEVPDGFQVNLFASEQEGLTSPLNIRWDPAGRMYVTVTTTYPHVFPGDLPNDKIILLEDRDGDGRADKSGVFADGLNIPTGIEWGEGGVFVGQNTELLFLMDTNNDGRADERQVMLSGFGNGDSHQTINSFIWSPDGELYFGQGDGCESRVETPWGASNLYQAGFYRLRPRRLKLDPLLDDFMGPGNPWGVAFDRWGQIFAVDGAGGVTFLSPGQIPTTHRLKIGRIGDPGGYCGIGYLDGRHIPEAMQGHFAIGDFKANRVKRFSVSDEGAGFKLHWEEPLLRSSHRNFRPVDVKVGPDGAIYVVDWYNPITCHQDDAYRDPTRDKAHGRIWRISTTRPTTHPDDFSKAPLPAVLSGLASPEHWTRYQAKRELTRRDTSEVATALDNWIRSLDPSVEEYEHHLCEALGASATLEIINLGLLHRVLQSQEPRARAYATRLVGRWHDRLENPLALLADRVEDADPRVRMEAAMACAAIPSAEAVTILARLADHPINGPLQYAFKQAVHHLRPHWQPALLSGKLTFQNPQQLASILNEVGGRDLVDGLKDLITDGNVNGNAKLTAIAAILSVGNPEELAQYGLESTVFEISGRYDPAMHAAALAKLVDVAHYRDIRPAGDLTEQLGLLLASPHDAVRASAFRLIAAWRVGDLTNTVTETAANNEAAVSVRQAAFAALGELQPPQAKEILTTGAADGQPLAVRIAAVENLAGIDLLLAAEHAPLLLVHGQIRQPQMVEVLAAFLSRNGGAAILAESLQKSPLAEPESRRILAALFATGRSDLALLGSLNQSLGPASQPPIFNQQHLLKVVDDAKAGDATRGSIVFTSLACTSCHKIGGRGGVVGPNLSSIGTTLSSERIVEELLWPNRQVKEGYAVLRVLTDDGRIVQGYERKTKASQQSGDLLLEDLTSGKLVIIKPEKIEEKQRVGSAMPTGITAVLSAEQLADLVRYLTDLGKIK